MKGLSVGAWTKKEAFRNSKKKIHYFNTPDKHGNRNCSSFKNNGIDQPLIQNQWEWMYGLGFNGFTNCRSKQSPKYLAPPNLSSSRFTNKCLVFLLGKSLMNCLSASLIFCLFRAASSSSESRSSRSPFSNSLALRVHCASHRETIFLLMHLTSGIGGTCNQLTYWLKPPVST